MRNIITFIVLSSLVGCQSACYALQIKPVKDNQTVFVKISSKELSQIFITNDRISSVRGIDGEYQLTKDEQKGAVFIKPTPLFQHQMMTVFIMTEQEHSYTLLLNPLDIPSETIELKPLSPSKKIAEHWEKSSPYTDLMMALLKSMSNQKNPEGYAVISLGAGHVQKLSSGITMQLITLYKGSQIEGEIWKLKNDSKITQTLEPHYFYQEATRAVAIADEKLRAGDETLLYRVVDYVG